MSLVTVPVPFFDGPRRRRLRKKGTGTVAATFSACVMPAYATEPVPIFRETRAVVWIGLVFPLEIGPRPVLSSGLH